MGRTLFFSSTQIPSHNLAIEEYLFNSLPPNNEMIFMYRNLPSTIIGTFQNPWTEADCEWLVENGYPILRRISGGGTVWHDPGNLNIAWFGSRQYFRRQNLQLLLREALGKFNLPVDISDHGDLLHHGEKLSGNAFCIKSDRVLHHATLLINADLEKLRRALRPDFSGWEIRKTRGVASRRMSVRQIADIMTGFSVTEFSGNFPEALQTIFKPNQIQAIDPAISNGISPLIEKYGDWEWNFGKTPDFVVRKTTQNPTSAELEIKKGHIMADGKPGIKFPGFSRLANIV